MTRALTGVLRARLYAQRRVVLSASAGALVAGLLAPASTAGPLFFCSLLGIVLALTQSPGIHPHLDRAEQSAPLFGRELARAKALVPCVATAITVVLYVGAGFPRDPPAALLALPIALSAAVAATLVALSATIRSGLSRALYVLLAVATSLAAYGIAQRSVLGEVAFCVAVAFFALRQYGEALARYDPI